MDEPMFEIIDAETNECVAIIYGPDFPGQSDNYIKSSISKKLRWEVWERDNFTCQICGKRKYLHIDHIVPESRGGLTSLENLQTLCKSCNSRKGSK